MKELFIPLILIVPLIFFSGCTSEAQTGMYLLQGNLTSQIINNTFIINGTGFIGTATTDLNMNGYSIINATWLNGTKGNFTSICIGGSCYSSLTGLTETDPFWSGNYSLYNASWSLTYNSTYNAKISDNSTWNETRANALYAIIGTGGNTSWNETHARTLFALIGSGGNSTWNESLADSKYYLISNPFNFINDTSWNTSLAQNSTLSAYDTCLQSFTELDPDYNSNPLGYINNTAWNNTNPFGYFNKSSDITAITNPYYYNMTNNTFNYMANTSLQTTGNWSWVYSLTNPLYINMSNTSWALTQTTANSQFMNMSNQSVTANNSIYLNGQLSTFYVNSTNNTFAKNSTLSTYDAKISFVNGTAYNTTILNATRLVSTTHCFVETCLKNITYNGTNVLIYG